MKKRSSIWINDNIKPNMPLCRAIVVEEASCIKVFIFSQVQNRNGLEVTTDRLTLLLYRNAGIGEWRKTSSGNHIENSKRRDKRTSNPSFYFSLENLMRNVLVETSSEAGSLTFVLSIAESGRVKLKSWPLELYFQFMSFQSDAQSTYLTCKHVSQLFP